MELKKKLNYAFQAVVLTAILTAAAIISYPYLEQWAVDNAEKQRKEREIKEAFERAEKLIEKAKMHGWL
jgi:hypothetical protein